MKTIPTQFITALALMFSSCESSPPFNIRLVDSASGAPIGGAEVERYTDSGRWTTSRESNTYLGETDGTGMFSVKGLDMDATHRLSFYKGGYLNMYVFAANIDEEDVCWISNGLGYIGDAIPLANSPTVEVRMSRGRETRRRTPIFSTTSSGIPYP